MSHAAVVCATGLVIGTWAALYTFERRGIKRRAQMRMYRSTRRRAERTGKPLVVVGDAVPPGCGDVGVDRKASSISETGRGACDVETWADQQSRNSCVLFDSEVLMYVEEDRLQRVQINCSVSPVATCSPFTVIFTTRRCTAIQNSTNTYAGH